MSKLLAFASLPTKFQFLTCFLVSNDECLCSDDGGAELSDNMFGNNANTNFDYFYGGASGGGRPSPIIEPEKASFFIALASTQTDLAMSTVQANGMSNPGTPN